MSNSRASLDIRSFVPKAGVVKRRSRKSRTEISRSHLDRLIQVDLINQFGIPIVSYTYYSTRRLSYMVNESRSLKYSEYIRLGQSYDAISPSLPNVRRFI